MNSSQSGFSHTLSGVKVLSDGVASLEDGVLTGLKRVHADAFVGELQGEQLATKADLVAPSFTGPVGVAGDLAVTGLLTAPRLGVMDQSIAARAPLAGPTFTGPVGVTGDLAVTGLLTAPVLTTMQEQIDEIPTHSDKAPILNPTFVGTVTSNILLAQSFKLNGPNCTVDFAVDNVNNVDARIIGYTTGTGQERQGILGIECMRADFTGGVDVTGVLAAPVITEIQGQVAVMAPVSNPTFTGTVSLLDVEHSLQPITAGVNTNVSAGEINIQRPRGTGGQVTVQGPYLENWNSAFLDMRSGPLGTVGVRLEAQGDPTTSFTGDLRVRSGPVVFDSELVGPTISGAILTGTTTAEGLTADSVEIVGPNALIDFSTGGVNDFDTRLHSFPGAGQGQGTLVVDNAQTNFSGSTNVAGALTGPTVTGVLGRLSTLEQFPGIHPLKSYTVLVAANTFYLLAGGVASSDFPFRWNADDSPPTKQQMQENPFRIGVTFVADVDGDYTHTVGHLQNAGIINTVPESMYSVFYLYDGSNGQFDIYLRTGALVADAPTSMDPTTPVQYVSGWYIVSIA